MSHRSSEIAPGLPHQNLEDGVNRSIVQSEVEGGVYLTDLPVGSRLELATRNHRYRLVHQGEGRAMISGHPNFCPEPVEVAIAGCNWGGTLLKESYLGRGMCLEFQHPVYHWIITSPILAIFECDSPPCDTPIPPPTSNSSVEPRA